MASGSAQLKARARLVKALVLDIDGVMTDRRIILDSHGNQIKAFDVRDGFGLILARQAGLKLAIITAERSGVVTLRAQQLKMDWVAQFARDKKKAFERFLRRFKLSPSAVAYVGDDLLDIPVLKQAGFSVTVADAPEMVKAQVHFVTKAPGGRGAVREVVERILQAQGRWSKVVEKYL